MTDPVVVIVQGPLHRLKIHYGQVNKYADQHRAADEKRGPSLPRLQGARNRCEGNGDCTNSVDEVK